MSTGTGTKTIDIAEHEATLELERLAQELKNVKSLTALTERLMAENERLKMLVPRSADDLEDDADDIRELFRTGGELEALRRLERHDELVYRHYILRRAMRCEDCPHGSR